jgi:hypothetical protein
MQEQLPKGAKDTKYAKRIFTAEAQSTQRHNNC